MTVAEKTWRFIFLQSTTLCLCSSLETRHLTSVPATIALSGTSIMASFVADTPVNNPAVAAAVEDRLLRVPYRQGFVVSLKFVVYLGQIVSCSMFVSVVIH